jgi:hypothetical protein
MGVDSNVFDTQVIDWPTAQNIQPVEQVLDFDRTGPNEGWVLLSRRLLTTRDHAQTWLEITPADLVPRAAVFSSPETGWVAGFDPENGELMVAATLDSGATWTNYRLASEKALAGRPVSRMWITTLDQTHLWVVLEQQTGGSFSIGHLFASEDGGYTWEYHTLPFASPVVFLDENTGLIAGGPSGRELFRSTDGGQTWESVHLAGLDNQYYTLGRPSPTPGGFLLTVHSTNSGTGEVQIMLSNKSAENWKIAQLFKLPDNHLGSIPEIPIGFLQPDGLSYLENLPPGAVQLAPWKAESAWVLVQHGECEGDKVLSPETYTCRLTWELVKGTDRGEHWEPINLSAVQSP